MSRICPEKSRSRRATSATRGRCKPTGEWHPRPHLLVAAIRVIAWRREGSSSRPCRHFCFSSTAGTRSPSVRTLACGAKRSGSSSPLEV